MESDSKKSNSSNLEVDVCEGLLIDNSSRYTECMQQSLGTDHCSSECCDEDLHSPYHLNINFYKTKKKQGKQSRLFQRTWFDEHKWLTFCVTCNKAYFY